MRFRLNNKFGKRKILLPLFFLVVVGLSQSRAQQIRDLYCSNFSEVLNDSIHQKHFFKAVDQYAINRITIAKLFNFYHHPYLRNFLRECWSRGIREISSGLPVKFMGTKEFEDLAFNQNFDSYTYEREWWNDTIDSSPKADLKQLQKLKRENPKLSFTIYYGWFGDAEDKQDLALTTINTFDNILIHHYRDKPDFEYIKPRLLTFAKAASRYRKEQSVIVRISVEERYIKDVTPQKLGEFFDKIMADFRLAQQQYPELKNIKIKGWQVYNSSYLKVE